MTIKDLRQNNGYNQREFAKLLDVTQTAVYKWELRDVKLRKGVQDKIREVFGYKKDNYKATSFDIGTNNF